MIFKSKLYLRCKDKSIFSGKNENIFILIIENLLEKLWFYMIFFNIQLLEMQSAIFL